jgi:hypothetical protein
MRDRRGEDAGGAGRGRAFMVRRGCSRSGSTEIIEGIGKSRRARSGGDGEHAEERVGESTGMTSVSAMQTCRIGKDFKASKGRTRVHRVFPTCFVIAPSSPCVGSCFQMKVLTEGRFEGLFFLLTDPNPRSGCAYSVSFRNPLSPAPYAEPGRAPMTISLASRGQTPMITCGTLMISREGKETMSQLMRQPVSSQ